jgi:hypothetical protein
MQPVLNAPGTRGSKPKYDNSLPSFAFNFNLRPYKMVTDRSRSVGAIFTVEGLPKYTEHRIVICYMPKSNFTATYPSWKSGDGPNATAVFNGSACDGGVVYNGGAEQITRMPATSPVTVFSFCVQLNGILLRGELS